MITPGTPTLPGQDYPPVLLPCQGTITPHTQGGTPTLLGQDYPPVLLPCQGAITPHTKGGTLPYTYRKKLKGVPLEHKNISRRYRNGIVFAL